MFEALASGSENGGDDNYWQGEAKEVISPSLCYCINLWLTGQGDFNCRDEGTKKCSHCSNCYQNFTQSDKTKKKKVQTYKEEWQNDITK